MCNTSVCTVRGVRVQIPVGVKVADTGEVILNPDHSYTLATEDQVLFLAEDDDTYAPLPMVRIAAPPLPHPCPRGAHQCRKLAQ